MVLRRVGGVLRNAWRFKVFQVIMRAGVRPIDGDVSWGRSLEGCCRIRGGGSVKLPAGRAGGSIVPKEATASDWVQRDAAPAWAGAQGRFRIPVRADISLEEPDAGNLHGADLRE